MGVDVNRQFPSPDVNKQLTGMKGFGHVPNSRPTILPVSSVQADSVRKDIILCLIGRCFAERFFVSWGQFTDSSRKEFVP